MANQFLRGYALLVGIGRYKESSLTVPETAQDAEDLKTLLIDPNYCGYPETQVRILSNESATSQNILQALGQLAEDINNKQATVILFFSGHGWNEAKIYYFLTHDTELVYDNEHKRRVNRTTVIANDELVACIRTISQQANKTLVILDTCFSGGLGTPLGPEDSNLREHLVPLPLSSFDDRLDNLAQGKGTAIFMSSQQGEKSWILGSITQPARNSLFVDKLIIALKGEGVTGTEPTINLLPLIDTVKRAVRETARNYNLNQDPDYKIYGGMEGEFPIALRLGGQLLSPRDTSQTQATKIKQKPREYNFKTIHELLAETFTPTELDRFLRNSPTSDLRRIRWDFNPRMGLNEMIDVVIDFCQKFILTEILLEEVKAYNPAQYDLHADALYRD